jgi:hypothetical protein
MYSNLAPGADDLLERIRDRLDVTRQVRHVPVEDWAILCDAFDEWPFAPDVRTVFTGPTRVTSLTPAFRTCSLRTPSAGRSSYFLEGPYSSRINATNQCKTNTLRETNTKNTMLERLDTMAKESHIIQLREAESGKQVRWESGRGFKQSNRSR